MQLLPKMLHSLYKLIDFRGMSYQAFTKMYEATVVLVITYASSIKGCDSFVCVDAVQIEQQKNFFERKETYPKCRRFGRYWLEYC